MLAERPLGEHLGPAGCLPSLQATQALIDREQLGERFTQLVADHLVVVDQEVDEQRLVQTSAPLVTGPTVELVGILQQSKAGVDVRSSFAKYVLDLPELLLDPLSLPRDGQQLAADGRLA